MSELNLSRGDGYGLLLALFDHLRNSGIGQYSASKKDSNLLIARSAKLYHAVADADDFMHSSLPPEVEEQLVTAFGEWLTEERTILKEALK